MNTQLTFKQLNELLFDFGKLASYGEVVERKSKEENNYDFPYFVVKLNEAKFGKDMFIKVDEYEDSYGENHKITGIQFVKPTKVVVTDFQSL